MGLIFKSPAQKRKQSEAQLKKTAAAFIHYQKMWRKKEISERDRKIIEQRLHKLRKEAEEMKERIKKLGEKEIREKEREERKKQESKK